MTNLNNFDFDIYCHYPEYPAKGFNCCTLHIVYWKVINKKSLNNVPVKLVFENVLMYM